MASLAKLMRWIRPAKLRTGLDPTSQSAIKSAISSSHDLIEEQTLPQYNPQYYYPVRLGEIFNHRYQILLKLGYGTGSTVWLAQDIRKKWVWQSNRFVTVKILTKGLRENNAVNTELEISRCIATKNPKSEGLRCLRTVLDSFEVVGPYSTHIGLVYAPMRESLCMLQKRLPNGQIPTYFLKPLVLLLLTGLDYLHNECRVIHTDLKPDNILLALESQAVLDKLVKAEVEEPTSPNIEGDRLIYRSRILGDYEAPPGRPKIADFGLAVWGDVPEPHNHPIQADLYQAPEVILRAGWTYSVDIWNLGVMLWDLLENKTLFKAVGENSRAYSPEAHLLEMADFLGPPPTELLRRAKWVAPCFTSEGTLSKGHRVTENALTLESSVETLAGEEKRLFLNFVQRMLRWMPEDRATAGELRRDPWFNAKR